MLDGAKVLPPQPGQGGAVDLGVTAHKVVDARMEELAVLVVPCFVRFVAPLVKHNARLPVLRLLRQIIAALDQQYAHSAIGQRVCQRTATCARANNNQIIIVHMSLTGH